MSANGGWLKLHRKLQDSDVFNDPDLLRLWMLCLMKASHSKRLVEWQGEKIELLPGQFITGRSALYEDYNEGLSAKLKVKDTTLWSRLKKIEGMGSLSIDSDTLKKASIITLTNWKEHQARDSEEDPDIEETEPEEEEYKEEVSEEMGEFIKAGEITDLTPAPTSEEKIKKPAKKGKGKGKRVYEKGDVEYKLASRLFYWILKNNPKAKYPDPQKWSDSIRLMMERDDRSESDLLAVIDWCQNDDFWMSNILSPEKLRKQFDTLYIQREKDLQKKAKALGSAGGSRGARKNDLLREMMEREDKGNGSQGNNKTLFLNN